MSAHPYHLCFRQTTVHYDNGRSRRIFCVIFRLFLVLLAISTAQNGIDKDPAARDRINLTTACILFGTSNHFAGSAENPQFNKFPLSICRNFDLELRLLERIWASKTRLLYIGA